MEAGLESCAEGGAHYLPGDRMWRCQERETPICSTPHIGHVQDRRSAVGELRGGLRSERGGSCLRAVAIGGEQGAETGAGGGSELALAGGAGGERGGAFEGYGYSHFCALYNRWRQSLDVVMRQEHRAGEKLFADLAGDKVTVHEPGGEREAQLFVAALGASSYTFAEASCGQDLENWTVFHGSYRAARTSAARRKSGAVAKRWRPPCAESPPTGNLADRLLRGAVCLPAPRRGMAGPTAACRHPRNAIAAPSQLDLPRSNQRFIQRNLRFTLSLPSLEFPWCDRDCRQDRSGACSMLNLQASMTVRLPRIRPKARTFLGVRH